MEGGETEEKEGVAEETQQVHVHGIRRNKCTTSSAICLILFRLVVPTALILIKSETLRQSKRRNKGKV